MSGFADRAATRPTDSTASGRGGGQRRAAARLKVNPSSRARRGRSTSRMVMFMLQRRKASRIMLMPSTVGSRAASPRRSSRTHQRNAPSSRTVAQTARRASRADSRWSGYSRGSRCTTTTSGGRSSGGVEDLEADVRTRAVCSAQWCRASSASRRRQLAACGSASRSLVVARRAGVGVLREGDELVRPDDAGPVRRAAIGVVETQTLHATWCPRENAREEHARLNRRSPAARQLRAPDPPVLL